MFLYIHIYMFCCLAALVLFTGGCAGGLTCIMFICKVVCSSALVQLNTFIRKAWLPSLRILLGGCFRWCYLQTQTSRGDLCGVLCRYDGQSDSLTCDKDMFRTEDEYFHAQDLRIYFYFTC